MRLSFESIVAPENGTSGVPVGDQALLSGITVDATKLNMLDGITGNVQSRLNDVVGTGGTLTGNVTLNGAPTVALHAASKSYVDGSVVSGKLSTGGGTMTGTLTLSGVATAPLGAITKQQMDDAITAATGGGGGGSLIENWPRWDTNPSEQIGLGWTTFQNKLNAIIAEVRKAPLASYAKLALTYSFGGAYSFSGGVLMADGRVYCTPSNSTTARIYDPVTDTVSIPTGTFSGSDGFLGGVLMTDGRVYIAPKVATTARIYDPVTDTLTTPAGTFGGGGANLGALLLKDGRVFVIGFNTVQSRIYNPVTNTLTTIPEAPIPMDIRGSAVLLPDGRVFMSSYIATVGGGSQGTRAFIYDPVANTWGSEIIIESTIVAGFGIGVLMADGRIYLPPYNATTARIYDPVANTVTIPAGSFGGNASHATGTLLPDGRVFLVPCNTSTPARIYDPYTNTLTVISGTYAGVAYACAILLPDGRLFLPPVGSSTAAVTQANTTNLQGNKKLPNNMVLSPLLMRCSSRN